MYRQGEAVWREGWREKLEMGQRCAEEHWDAKTWWHGVYISEIEPMRQKEKEFREELWTKSMSSTAVYGIFKSVWDQQVTYTANLKTHMNFSDDGNEVSADKHAEIYCSH